MKIKLLHTFGALLLLNALYASFFFERTYLPVSIRTSIVTSAETTIWYVFKNSYSEERIFSERKKLSSGEALTFEYDIPSDEELEYIGLFWLAEKNDSLLLKDYGFSLGTDYTTGKGNRQIIDYVSGGSTVFSGTQGVSVKTIKGGRNWIMLDGTEDINMLRDKKQHGLPPFWANGILLVLLILFQRSKFLNPPKFNFDARSLRSWRIILFSLWVLLMPFWVLVGHFILATLVFLVLLEIIAFKSGKDLWSRINDHKLPYVLYAVIVLTSFVSSSAIQTADSSLDMSYFVLVPVAFYGLSVHHRRVIYWIFEKSVLSFLILLLIYTTDRFLRLDPDYGFLRFLELNVEQFWHTSYLSALIIVVIIKNIKKELFRKWHLILVYMLALAFMFFMNARLPFIVTALLLSYQVYRELKPGVLKRLYVGIVCFLSAALVMFFLFRSQPVNETPSGLSDINSLDARVSVWTASLSAIKKNAIFGVGSKNTRDAIYNNIGDNLGTKFRNYNCHNQFLELALSHGLLALIVFLLMLWKLFRRTPIYAKCLGLTFVLLFMVESYLQVQAGVIFFTFWYFFMIEYNPENIEDEE